MNIDYVNVGHAGNAADPATGSLYGAVANGYRIGKHEVTNAQYAEFLNAVDPAGANPNGIYDSNMGSDVRGGISFNAGAANGSKYTSRSSMGDKPVNWVSWRSAARFANWLHNGQASGSTETGAYTMSANPVIRNVGATVFLPSENEWYKAAYYDPTPGAGGGDNYWTYATQSNTVPTAATANATGDVTNPGANVQNYGNGADWPTPSQNGNVTTVGSTAANNYFGTQDMGGNVREWLEDGGNNREIRGTSWGGSAAQSSSGDVSTAPNTSVFVTHGFRVASPPEPTTVLPTVTGVSPNTGATVGGTSVTLTGTYFTGATGVTFGGTAAANLVVVNATTITCATPAGAAGTASVLVTTPGGTNTANTLFTYVAPPPPTLTSITPNTGSSAGGESVTLTGSNFAGATSVTFGGTDATNLAVVNATTLTCTTPASAAGTASVLVTAPGGTNTANTLFTYVTPPEDRFSPNGEFVLRFQSDGNVVVRTTSPDAYFWDAITQGNWFGGIASNFLFSYQNGIIQRINRNTGAVIDEHVIQANVSGSTYIGVNNAGEVKIFPTDPPTLTSVSPNTGTTEGGTSVTLTGTNFTEVTSVTFGGTAASSFDVVNGTTITCTTPVGAAGTASVLVTTPAGTNAENTLFTYVAPPPSLTSIAPNRGSTAGGDIVRLSGTNFTGATSVTFGGAAATNLVVVDAGTLTCTTPASAAGTSSVILTTPAGTSVENMPFIFRVPSAPPSSSQLTIDYVSVGHAGNPADPRSDSVYGGVAYDYRIGKHEVTNAQFTVFLNAVDPTGVNPNGIYDASMGSDPRGGINYTAGASNGSKYTIRSSMGDKPVNFVSWYDAARFTNWLHNGQGDGSTETGSYTLSGSTGLITKNMGATVWLPSEDEWYKAAYYDPTAGAGGGDNYWDFPTQSNTTPTFATADENGDVSNPGSNVANWFNQSSWNGVSGGNVTTVGSASANNFFGAQDMAGNVEEWNDAVINSSRRGARGGRFSNIGSTFMFSQARLSQLPQAGVSFLGFRVASIPEQVIALPTITSVSPAAGATAGGISVTLTGTNFTGASTVTFGGTAATNLVVLNGTTITCTTPASLAGPSSVLVTTPGGTNAANTLFTYAALPEDRFSPDGQFVLRFESNGNVVVRRTSTNAHFWDAITQQGNWFDAPVGNSLFSYQNGTIQRINRSTGTVIDEYVIQSNVSGCTYLGVNNAGGVEIVSCNPASALPTITSVIPNSGSTAGATHVTLFGLNFTGATSVTFDGMAAMRFLVVNNNTITCNTPVGTAGTASVLVTTPVGTNAENALFTYVYSSLEQATPQVASFAIDANKNPVLQWQAEAGRRYSVLYSNDLKKFTPIAEGFPFGGALSPSLQFKDIGIFTGTNPRGFYTVEKNSSGAPDSRVELDAFFASNRGKAGFRNNQVMALETLLFALDEIEAGQLVEARARVDAMLAAYPLSTPGWNAGNGYRGLNLGNPAGYYGVRMLDQILTLGNPSRSNKGKLRITALVAPSAVVTRPTLPNLVPETVNLNIAPEILAEDARRLHLVTRLFRRWFQAVMGGVEVELSVHVMDQGTTVDFTNNPTTFGSYPDHQAMVNSMPESITRTTDLWWVIAPSGVPGDGSGFGKTWVSGGVRFDNRNGLAVIICDDAWLTRKPAHLGKGLYSETELQMYLPAWFQHEIMHLVYQRYSKFGLEAESHQWFDRSTWPADFVGINEPDYYAESLTKRILNDSLSVADAFLIPDQADMAVFPLAKLVGSYRRDPVENGFHEVTISLDGGNLRWSNAAGRSWGLEIIGSDLWSGADAASGGAQKYRVVIDGDGNVIGVNPSSGTQLWRRTDYPQPSPAAASRAAKSIMPMPTNPKPMVCPGCSFHPTPN